MKKITGVEITKADIVSALVSVLEKQYKVTDKHKQVISNKITADTFMLEKLDDKEDDQTLADKFKDAYDKIKSDKDDNSDILGELFGMLSDLG